MVLLAIFLSNDSRSLVFKSSNKIIWNLINEISFSDNGDDHNERADVFLAANLNCHLHSKDIEKNK